ncbi:aldehyde dehydrogenase family protein [Rhodospirillaceae bacterium SYSU D60014]|uniref:aldehyde dehydrogenase family protein n=1 Tax=Virgifigura deserti TaxID=2268457 RepID=UPI000E672334
MTELKAYWRNFVGGKWVDGAQGRRITIENPATAEPLAEIARAEVEDVDRAVTAARRCFETGGLTGLRPADRAALMFRIAAEIEVLAEEIGLAECLDNGKRLSDARGEATAAARYFTYYGGLADKLEGRSIPLGAGYVDYTIPAPFGVSAQVVPWNFPIALAARSLSCALATGNSVVIKSPELSPLSICLLAQACERAGVPDGAVNVICGYGSDAGAALVAHGDVDHIVFTGSVKTGQSILRAAAERIIPCVMELGGKSAGIVYPDADLDQAVASTAIGIFSNAGQICSAASRLLVHRSVHDTVVDRLVARAKDLSIGPGIEEHDLTPLISAPQLDRVEAYCLAGVQAGAVAATGGRRVTGRPGHFMQPTIFTGVAPDMTIAREEIFGPVLSVMPFDEPAEAIAIANGTDYGLVAGVYTQDLALAHWSAERLVAGQVFVNEWFAGGVETPFGGTKRSGYGREKGQEALLNYVQTKNVAIRLGSSPGCA